MAQSSAENSLRRLAARQHQRGRVLSLSERLETVTASAREMIQPTVYGQAIIMLVYVPLLTFTGVEGKTFAPMAFTVIIALASAFVLSLTFVPAMIAIVVAGRVQEKEGLRSRVEGALWSRVGRRDPEALAGDRRGRLSLCRRGAAVHKSARNSRLSLTRKTS
jgi:cobalt-zinc-cadmium resistance protein CzcA